MIEKIIKKSFFFLPVSAVCFMILFTSKSSAGPVSEKGPDLREGNVQEMVEDIEIPEEERYDQEPPKPETEETRQEETAFVPEIKEIGNKIRIETPEGFSFGDEENDHRNSCSVVSDICSIGIYCMGNTSVSMETEAEIKSSRKKIKKIITDEEFALGRHDARYLETHVVKKAYELWFYIGLVELHEQTIKFEAITKNYDEKIKEEIKKVMENTCYAYWY